MITDDLLIQKNFIKKEVFEDRLLDKVYFVLNENDDFGIIKINDEYFFASDTDRGFYKIETNTKPLMCIDTVVFIFRFIGASASVSNINSIVKLKGDIYKEDVTPVQIHVRGHDVRDPDVKAERSRKQQERYFKH